jgi:hypothetical protein
VIRAYEDLEITHWDETIDPVRDMNKVNHEILMSVSAIFSLVGFSCYVELVTGFSSRGAFN